MNRAIVWGNIGRDPELRMSAGGTAVLKFSVATSERRKDQSGNWNEETEWHNVVCFGKRAEGLGSFLAKGASVLVEGKLRTSSWEDNNGQKRYKTEIVADEVKVTSKKDRDNGRVHSRAPAPEISDDLANALDDDSIPF